MPSSDPQLDVVAILRALIKADQDKGITRADELLQDEIAERKHKRVRETVFISLGYLIILVALFFAVFFGFRASPVAGLSVGLLSVVGVIASRVIGRRVQK